MQRKSVKRATSRIKEQIKELRLDLPFNLGEAKIEIGDHERGAAWALFVEMSTRISTQSVEKNASSVREALTSLYLLFGVTREVLKEAGPVVGQSAKSLGPLAIKILNEGLRPFLNRWHVGYRAYETAQALAMVKTFGLHAPSIELVDQADWSELDAFYNELETTRLELCKYVDMLATIAGVEPTSE